MDNYIRKVLDRRFREIKAAHGVDATGTKAKAKPSKSVTTLALEAYMANTPEADSLPNQKLDEKFVYYATSQIRLFLFAGTDTTASMMVYAYHMLAKHPEWRRKLGDEHDQVFGKDPNAAARVLKENPILLNNCKVTVAFIKEVLRLYAPAGTVRSGLPGVTITDHQGNEQPMDDVSANILHQALHVNPRVWPRPREFLPERFLVGPEDELYPDPAAFRPFEQGPRNCIGQTLVWNELRVAVVLTCRDLELRDAYDDFDAKRESELGVAEKTKRALFGTPVKTVHGERAYQTDSGGLHPANGYPCYVEWAKGD
jgi:cytochrome P450